MTTPGFTTTGFPDWSRASIEVANPVLTDVLTPVPNPKSYGPFYVGAFPTSQILCTPSGNNGAVNVNLFWYADQALTFQLGSLAWTTENQLPITDAIANLGPWLVVVITNVTSNPSLNAHLAVVGCTADPVSIRSALAGPQLQGNGVSVGANSSIVFDLPVVTSGPLYCAVAPGASAWSLTARTTYQGITGGYLGGTGAGQYANSQQFVIWSPRTHVQFTLVNGDAAVKQFAYSIYLGS